MLPESPVFCDWQAEGRKAGRTGGFLSASASLREKTKSFMRGPLLFDPRLDGLRDNAPFKQLARRMNLPS